MTSQTAPAPVAFNVANVHALLSVSLASADNAVLRGACAVALLYGKMRLEGDNVTAWDVVFAKVTKNLKVSAPSLARVNEGGWRIFKRQEPVWTGAIETHPLDVASAADALVGLFLTRHKSAAKLWTALDMDKPAAKKAKPAPVAKEAAAPVASDAQDIPLGLPEAAPAPATMAERIAAMVAEIDAMKAQDVASLDAATLLQSARELFRKVEHAAAPAAAPVAKPAPRPRATRADTLASLGAAMAQASAAA